MSDWLERLISQLIDNPLIVTAFGTAVLVPVLNFIATWAGRKTPPKEPVAYDARDLPEHPLLISAKAHLADEEMEILTLTLKEIRALHGEMHSQLQLINDRITILMKN